MSLEERLAELTAAIKINNELMVQNNQGRVDAMAKLDATKADAKVEATKPEEPKTEAVAEKKTRKPRTPKELTPEDLYKAFESYMKVDDEAERAARKEFVVSILNELGADAVTDKPNRKGIAPEDRQKALDWLAKKVAGEVVNFGSDAPAESDSLL